MCDSPITARLRVLGEAIGVKGSLCSRLSARLGQAAIKETDIKSLQQAGGWSSLAMPRRYADDAKIANEGVRLSR